MLGNLYRFYFQDKEKARQVFRGWVGLVNINIQKTLDAGYIDQYTRDAERFAEILGGARYEITKR